MARSNSPCTTPMRANSSCATDSDLARAMKLVHQREVALTLPRLVERCWTGAVDYSNAEVVESLQAVLNNRRRVRSVSAAHGYLFSTALGFGMRAQDHQ